MTAPSRLALGTAQFGLDYGITNRAGQVGANEIATILRSASDDRIDTLDTASLYGESEAAIGRCEASASFRVVTKTPKFGDAASAEEAVARLHHSLDSSLERLQRRTVDALLLHDANDLLGPHGAELWAALEQAKTAGLTRKIGISVYHGAQIDRALDRYPIEILQLPFNPLDRRLIEGGQIARLASAGVEIHARSLFLQGLLLQAPDAIEPRFGPLREAVADLHAWAAAAGLSTLEGILALALQIPEIARFVVGVTSQSELQEIVIAGKVAERVQQLPSFASSAPLDQRHLDPSRWGELGQPNQPVERTSQ